MMMMMVGMMAMIKGNNFFPTLVEIMMAFIGSSIMIMIATISNIAIFTIIIVTIIIVIVIIVIIIVIILIVVHLCAQASAQAW